MASYKRSILTRERILESASRLFYEKGYTAATAREIGAMSGISPSRINYHFSSKADLAGVICRQFFHDFTEEIQNAIDDHCRYSPLAEAIALRYLLRVIIEGGGSSAFSRFYQEIAREGVLSQVLATFDPEVFARDLDCTQFQSEKLRPEFKEVYAGILGASFAAVLHSWPKMLQQCHEDGDQSLKNLQDILVELFLNMLNCLPQARRELLELSRIYYGLMEVRVHSLMDVTIRLHTSTDGSEKHRLEKLFANA